MLHFTIPVATAESNLVFQRFPALDYHLHQASIEGTSRDISQLAPKPPANGESKGWWDKIKDGAETVMSAVSLDAIKKSVENLPERLIVIFVLQTRVLPIILMWALYRLIVGAVQPARVAG